MLIRFSKLFLLAIFFAGLLAFARSSSAQSNPTPAPLNRPDYDYTESNGCTRCHFSGGPHMPEAAGVVFNEATKAFALTGNGWRASAHAQTNYGSTQNTYCGKCHSPLQAKPEAQFVKGKFVDTNQIEAGKVEGVTCAVCHPPKGLVPAIGRRLTFYKIGMDKTKVEAYEKVEVGREDELCLQCHVTRHNEDNPAFKKMYDVGVRCMDCHMAPYDIIPQTKGTAHEVEKRFHDFKVAKNLPHSCGVQGSMVQCHPGMTKEGTLNFLPYMKEQHKDWGMLNMGKKKKKLTNSLDYYLLWQEIEAGKTE
jgi:hypothetical protein